MPKKKDDNNKDLKLETTVTYTTGCYAKCIYYFKKGEREKELSKNETSMYILHSYIVQVLSGFWSQICETRGFYNNPASSSSR